MRYLIAFLFTVLPVVPATAETFDERWMAVGELVHPARPTSKVLTFDVSKVRRLGEGCQELACQVVLAREKPHRMKYAERWHADCVEALTKAHGGAATWNIRDLTKRPSNVSWVMEPANGEGEGAGFLCLPAEEESAPQPKPRVPDITVAKPPQVESPQDVTPPIEVPPAPKTRDFRRSDLAKQETRVTLPKKSIEAVPLELRIIIGLCGGGRYDTGYERTDGLICGRGGAEFRYAWLLISAALVGSSDFSNVLLGGTGNVSVMLASFDVGIYGTIARHVWRDTPLLPGGQLLDWGARLGTLLADYKQVELSLQLDVSFGSRERMPAYTVPDGRFGESSTLGLGGALTILAKFPVL